MKVFEREGRKTAVRVKKSVGNRAPSRALLIICSLSLSLFTVRSHIHYVCCSILHLHSHHSSSPLSFQHLLFHRPRFLSFLFFFYLIIYQNIKILLFLKSNPSFYIIIIIIFVKSKRPKLNIHISLLPPPPLPHLFLIYINFIQLERENKTTQKRKKKKQMKREHPYPLDNPAAGAAGKSKMEWEKEEGQNEAGVDELLAVLGYKVRSSDMNEVANKIQQLEAVIGNNAHESDGFSDKVHYNPSDLSTWLESMLSEFNPSITFPLHHPPLPSVTVTATSSSSAVNFEDLHHVVAPVDPVFSDYDLKAIPGKAILSPPPPPPQPQPQPQSQTSAEIFISNMSKGSCLVSEDSCSAAKRMKPSNYGGSVTTTAVATAAVKVNNTAALARPMVVVDPQENGIRLVHTLMACAEAIQQENMGLAEALVKQIGFLATSQAGSMRKVATYFAEALARRVYKICSSVPAFDDNLSDMLQMHFYDTCPYLKFAHFTANQAILEAFSGKKKVHVIDFSMNQGMQWPVLMQALALRPEGPPTFRLTGIGPPAPDNSDRLQEVGWKLAEFADSIHIKFEYRGFVANSLTDLEAGLLDLKPESETVAVNSVFELHRLLGRPGAVEKVLGMIKEVNPVILTVVEQEANHNGPVFVDRFNEALHYYSTMFDSLETCENNKDKMMTEVYLGRQICNVVACDGVDRVERHETLAQWRTRFNSAEFSPVHLGSNTFNQVSMLLEYFAGGDGYGVEEHDGCLMLGWHNRPLITTSAWQLSKKTRC